MRYVSEQFQAIQNEIIRPQLQLHFEVNTGIMYSAWAINSENIDFDDTVAPVIEPDNCLNDHYYAVLGEPCGVDDPNRICAPDNTGALSTPKTTVPYGVTPYTAANTEAFIGSDVNYYDNFNGLSNGATLCFKGLIPEEVRVEIYDTDTSTWSTETTIVNTDMSEEIPFVPVNSDMLAFRRFYVKNSTTAGRFQLLWIKRVRSATQGNPVVFENEYVSNISISIETDLTSQSLPQYEMTVECLDIDEIYTPESSYWSNEFSEGKYCLLKVGYEIGDTVEYIPIMYGVLTKKPTFSAGKITFNVSFEYGVSWTIDFMSRPNNSYSTGALVDGAAFKDLIDDNSLFNTYDIFSGSNDENSSVCNYYGAPKAAEAVQLIANALGGYLTAAFGSYDCKYDLHRTVDVQYKLYDDYLPRNDQVQCALDSHAKVGKIEITKHNYTVSSGYSDVQSGSVRLSQGEQAISFNVPFYAIGKTTAQSFPSGYSITDFGNEYANDDGTIRFDVIIKKSTSGSATQNLKVRFYQVDDRELKYGETLSDVVSGEAYENNNVLVTNDYVARKTNSVAHLVSNTSDQYEVDYLQDLRYELGDVIRLETQKGIFKSCVITGLQYNFPGSTGHITCKRIFALEDTPEAFSSNIQIDVFLEKTGDVRKLMIPASEIYNNGVVFGVMKDIYNSNKYVVVLGANDCFYAKNGVALGDGVGVQKKDDNLHIWNVAYIKHSSDADFTGDQRAIDNVVELPDYDANAHDINANPLFYAANKLIEHLYESQSMTAPVEDSNTDGTIWNIWG